MVQFLNRPRHVCDMAKNKKEKSDRNVATSFLGGLICTLLLLVVVPVVSDMYIRPVVEDLVQNTAIVWLSSSLLVTIIMLIVLILFTLVLGGGAILRRYGAIGVVALIVAYWLLGNLRGAVLPVAVLIIMYLWGLRKGKH